MASRLRRLIAPNDPESLKLQKLTETLSTALPADVQRVVQALPSDGTAAAEEKWRRAVTEGLADVQARAAVSGGHNQFVFDQAVPSDEWTINHNLGGYPAVAIVDSGNNVGFGEVTYLTTNSLRVRFSASFSGRAFLVL